MGTMGTVTPAMRPISPANMPPAFTTTSQAIGPADVCTPRTRPRSTSIPVTRVPVMTSTPRDRAPAARASVSSDGST
jgi:hypothetical protein